MHHIEMEKLRSEIGISAKREGLISLPNASKTLFVQAYNKEAMRLLRSTRPPEVVLLGKAAPSLRVDSSR